MTEKDNFPRITLEDDEPILTTEKLADYFMGAMAGIGIGFTVIVLAFWLGYSA